MAAVYPRDIRVMSMDVVIIGLGAAGVGAARRLAARGLDLLLVEVGDRAAFDFARGQIGGLAGSRAKAALRPLAAATWARTDWIGGSHARPGHSDARAVLPAPVGGIAFAGEATHATDVSTAHGAFESDVRAADEIRTMLETDG